MINVVKFIFNPLQENTYLVWDETKECIIIDAGCATPKEEARLIDFITEHELHLVMAVNTHGHFDHTMGVAHLCETFSIPFALSLKDEPIAEQSRSYGEVFGVEVPAVPKPVIDLSATDSLQFGSTMIQVLHTPGHTPGGVALYEPQSKSLFSGDTLFRESIGRTDLPGGDYSALMHSIVDVIVPLGDEVIVYPGHGEKSSIGHETLYNPFVVEALQGEINY